MAHKWWQNAVIYQIYPMSFQDSNNDGIGDLPGIEQRLPYLQKLGVDVLWLNPIYKSPNKDNGYDISDYEQIQPVYGSMAEFDKLLSQIHKHGMKLLMDLVVNHTSDQHRWFQESKRSKDGKYSDYYIWRDPVDGHEPTTGTRLWRLCLDLCPGTRSVLPTPICPGTTRLKLGEPRRSRIGLEHHAFLVGQGRRWLPDGRD